MMLFTDPKVKGSKRSGKPRRSKGCTTCIQRKVKCDEKTPTCGQCLKGGRKCSGMASAIFMNMDSTTLATTSTFAPRDDPIERSTKPKKSKEPTLIIEEIIHTPTVQLPTPAGPPSHDEPPKEDPTKGKTDQSSQLESSEQGRSFRSPGHSNSWALAPSVKSSQVMIHQFLSHFLNYFARVSPNQDVIFNSWMGGLPEMLSASTSRQPSVGKTIAAVSMMYYGRRTNDRAIMMEAHRCYGAGIVTQRKVLDEICRTRRSPTIEELCTPLLMSFFEITCCTSQTAYFEHLLGAAMLLEAYGPLRCSEGILFEIFHALRLQLNYACIVMRTSSPFSTPEWLRDPFTNREKSQIDTLVDTITICTSLHSRIDTLRTTPRSASEHAVERDAIRTRALALKKDLDAMWGGLRARAATQGWEGDYFDGVPGVDSFQVQETDLDSDSDIDIDLDLDLDDDDDEEENDDRATGMMMTVEYPPLHPTSHLPHPVREPFSTPGPSARPVGFYSTARMLVLTCLHLVGARPELYREQMEAHCASVLAMAGYISGMEVGYAYLRLVLPLQVVGLFSPRKVQRGRARGLLGEWSGVGGMAGICEIGLRGLGGRGRAGVWGDLAGGEDRDLTMGMGMGMGIAVGDGRFENGYV